VEAAATAEAAQVLEADTAGAVQEAEDNKRNKTIHYEKDSINSYFTGIDSIGNAGPDCIRRSDAE
jgi:hypothetical protein